MLLSKSLILRQSHFKKAFNPIRMDKKNYNTQVTPTKAAYFLIGDEVLSGTVKDTNGPFLANYLRKQGIELSRIEVIPDKIETIVESIHRIRNTVDYIVTSGGIGPTHDDVTYDAVAAAYNTTLEYDPKTLDELTKYMVSKNSEMTEERKRMALFPKGCKTFFPSAELWVPVVIMGNVHIYPGVPRLFEKMILGSDSLFVGGVPYVQYEVFTRMLEGDLAKELKQIAMENPRVKIGSYPSMDHDTKMLFTRLFLEGRDEIEVKSIANRLAEFTKAYKIAVRPVEGPNIVAKL